MGASAARRRCHWGKYVVELALHGGWAQGWSVLFGRAGRPRQIGANPAEHAGQGILTRRLDSSRERRGVFPAAAAIAERSPARDSRSTAVTASLKAASWRGERRTR